MTELTADMTELTFDSVVEIFPELELTVDLTELTVDPSSSIFASNVLLKSDHQ